MSTLKALRWQIVFPIMLIFAAVSVGGYLAKSSGEVHFLTEKAKYVDLRKTVVATGTIAPSQIVEVGAQVSGQIEKIHARMGQIVQAGDLLVEIDATTQTNELDALKAQLDTYLAQLESRRVSLLTAQRKFTRESSLRNQDATSTEELEAAQDNLAKAKAELTETESLIRQTRIEIRTAEANLGYTRITAPIDGVVVAVPVEAGQTVNANQVTPTLLKLADLKTMEVRMQVSEGDITLIKPGLPVTFSILSDSELVFAGVIDTIDPGDTVLSDSKEGSESGTSEKKAIYYYARMMVDNSDGILRTSMTTQCEILITEAPGVLVVPSYSIHERNGTRYVLVLRKGKIAEQPIETGISDHAYTQVVSGIEEGAEVVTVRMTDEEIKHQIADF